MIGNKRISIRTLGQMRIFLFKFEEKEDSDVAGRYCCLGRWPEGLWWLRSCEYPTLASFLIIKR